MISTDQRRPSGAPRQEAARLLWILPAALALFLPALGCSSKVTSVDPGFVSPEGKADPNSQLVVFEDRAIPRYFYKDNSPPGPAPGEPPPGPGPEDELDSVVYVRRATPATIHGMILDGTQALGYEVFRREDGGGMRRLQDFVSQPFARWLDTQWEAYSFDDSDPARAVPPTYRGRGYVGGAVNPLSPLTNMASDPDTGLADPGLRVPHGAGPPNEAYTDSLFRLAWNPVPNAAGYYLHVFQFRNDLRDELERVLAGTPAPFFEGKSKDIYAAYFPGTITSHRLGDPMPAGAKRFTWRATFFGQTYYVRLTAVDANGRMIAFTPGDFRIGPYSEGYTLQRVGALAVVTQQNPPSGGIPNLAGTRPKAAR